MAIRHLPRIFRNHLKAYPESWKVSLWHCRNGTEIGTLKVSSFMFAGHANCQPGETEGEQECLRGLQREKRSIFRNPLLYTSTALLVALLYVSWVFYSRWQENREYEQKVAEREAQKRQEDERAVELMGGSRFDILNFYASPSVIREDQSSAICYSVSNAKKVRLDPPDANVWPSLSRCFQVSPKKTTTYTLTIEDAEGHEKSATVRVAVQ